MASDTIEHVSTISHMWRVRGLPIMALLTLTGCAGSLESGRDTLAAKRAGDHSLAAATVGPELSRDEAYCRSLDASRRTWGGLAKAAAVLGGAAGVGAIPADTDKWERNYAITGAVMAAFAAGALYLSEGAGDSWSAQCSVP